MSDEKQLTISADDTLWRRLTTPDWIKTADGTQRVSSAAFKGHETDLELSTHLSRLTTLEWVFATPPESLGIAEIVAAIPLELGLRVEHDPEPDDYSHTVIHLNTVYGQRKKHAKKMATQALFKPRPSARVASHETE